MAVELKFGVPAFVPAALHCFWCLCLTAAMGLRGSASTLLREGFVCIGKSAGPGLVFEFYIMIAHIVQFLAHPMTRFWPTRTFPDETYGVRGGEGS